MLTRAPLSSFIFIIILTIQFYFLYQIYMGSLLVTNFAIENHRRGRTCRQCVGLWRPLRPVALSLVV